MKIKILGSNGWYSTETGYTVCSLIETNDCYIVLDAGEGIRSLDQHVKDPRKSIFLFLSHFHLDHTSGFHILNKFQFSQPITIYGQPGSKEILNELVASPYTVPFKKLKTKVYLRELPEGISNPPLAPFPVECRYLFHKDPCFGYRFNVDGQVVTYCTDTGPCENLLKLAQKAKILIAECSAKEGQPEEEWQHLTPVSVAKVAKQANAEKLLLTHFACDSYPSLEERKKAEKIARRVFPDTIACYDGMEIEV